MKQIIITLLLILPFVTSFGQRNIGNFNTGQKTIVYTYDEAGNRIQRKTVFIDPIEKTNLQENEIWEEVKIYPNPAETHVNIDLPIALEEANIHLSDLQGKTVLVQKAAGTNQMLSLQNLSKGSYILTIKQKDQYHTWKVVKIK